MPTTAITVQALSTGHSTTGDDITWSAADAVNGNHFVWPSTGKLIVLARNVHASTTYTVTVTSVALSFSSRTGSISAVNVTAGNQKAIPLKMDGWKNSSGNCELSANNTNIQFAVLNILH